MSKQARIAVSGSGETHPTLGVFSNDIGTMAVTRESIGVYYLTCMGGFPDNDLDGQPRTWISQRIAYASNDGGVISTEIYRVNDDVIQIATQQDLTPFDFVQVSFEIRTRE